MHHILMDGDERLLDESLRSEILAAMTIMPQCAARAGLGRRKLPSRTGSYSPESIERE